MRQKLIPGPRFDPSELLSDVGWRSDPIHVDTWLANYMRSRYGTTLPELEQAWQSLRTSAYGHFTDHPRYFSQFRPGKVSMGTASTDPQLVAAARSFLRVAPRLKHEPLFVADAIELAALALSGLAELELRRAIYAHAQAQPNVRDQHEARASCLLRNLNRLMASHPLHRLERWVAQARSYGEDTKESDYYEANAKRIVTVWGPPIDDYSARIWSGLIGTYYLPRWQTYFESLRTGRPVDFPAWEDNWVNTPWKNTTVPFSDPLHEAGLLLNGPSLVTHCG